jgi:hypothetical protein
MPNLAVPSRASDAGPESGPAPRWIDCLEFAVDDIRDASRHCRDDLAAERKLRREAIEGAQEWLRRALEVLP